MIWSALAILLAMIAEQEREKYKSNFVPVRTVAHLGGAHSPEAVVSAPEPEPEPPGALDTFQADTFQNDAFQ